MNNQFNKVFPSFDPLNSEFRPDNRIIDCFSNHFSFHLFSKNSDCPLKDWIYQLDNIAIELSSSLLTALVVMDASIKNNIASLIVYIHVHNKLIVKTLYHTINITSTEAEFFAIRCGINQALYLQNIFKIIVITNSIYIAKKIFDPLSHPLQKQAALILNDLKDFFYSHYENIIKFWECPSKYKWNLHKCINIEIKSFNLTLLFPAKNSCDFNKKSKCNNIINNWKMTFQASDLKENNFLDLVNSDDKFLEPIYSKGGT